ncbi:PEPxxWA-CTERM sorting domain-containing protein [Sphingosinicellaceae bacterium]|nr:PEPxxWA-CTERM sorting domain-containing protein [Sphingosinicellaceae bacterium]
MTFTASAVSQVLSFLAVGTPNGAPPISFLDGVSLTAAVPEPATWGLMLVGFGAVGITARRRSNVVAA